MYGWRVHNTVNLLRETEAEVKKSVGNIIQRHRDRGNLQDIRMIVWWETGRLVEVSEVEEESLYLSMTDRQKQEFRKRAFDGIANMVERIERGEVTREELLALLDNAK